MQAIEEELPAVEEGASWWKDAVTDEFSRQDVVVLALIAIFALRLVIFVLQVMWKLVRLPIKWYDAIEKEVEELEIENSDKRSEESLTSLRKQLTIVRFCHLQFLLVIEKLKREMRGEKCDDTQQLVATLAASQHEEGKDVTLTEILATLRKIQAQDSSFEASAVEEHLVDIKQDVEDEEDIGSSLTEAWARLQEIYASFLRIQATIVRRQKRRQTWKCQLEQHEQHQEKGSKKRKRRLPSSEDPTDEVLHELQELTKELPQGFTADMFSSLGIAMHEKMVAAEPETTPTISLELETKPPQPTSVASVARAQVKYSATAQQAA
ncbi:hypothetical protein PHMEG_0004209 [Phytophthora megakarya]|uniref:Uncharacterized protein n=1 Tax=Phytophthora megakarya TaxID=4795 RepID=A0A225WUI9_9STRA|nr:hypothetical protein PHMEG_0004209 [Phytophthora megakarya]